MKYNQPFGISDPTAPYINGDPTVGRKGSIIPAAAVEYPQREIVTVIESASEVPDNGDLTQLLQAVRSQRMNYGLALNTGAGTANTVEVEFDPPISTTMTPGMPLRIKAVQNNTGATMLKVDGISNPLRYADGSELVAGAILTGVLFEAFWNDTGYWEFNPFLGVAGGGGSTTNTYINIPYVQDTGVTNALVGAYVPAITALTPGLTIEIKLANNITGPSTIKVNALAPVPIVRANGAPLQANDAVVSQIMLLIYNSAAGQFQFSGIIPQAFSGYGLPVGCIVLTPASVAPLGTVKLNGAMLLRAEHPALWAFANGSNRIVNESEWQNAGNRYWTAFSRGDGSTNFRLPDFRAEFMRFYDDGRGVDPRALTTQQDGQVGAVTATGTVQVTDVVFSWPNPPYPTPGATPDIWPGVTGWQGSGTLGLADSVLTNVTGAESTSSRLLYPLPNPKVMSGNMSLNLNPGKESRVRNTAIVPCIVDG